MDQFERFLILSFGNIGDKKNIRQETILIIEGKKDEINKKGCRYKGRERGRE